MNNSEKSVSETKAERKRVAATKEVAQPRPNALAAQSALQIGVINNITRWKLAYVPK